MKKLILALFVCWVTSLSGLSAFAQTSVTIAEKQFESGDYERALLNYVDLLQDKPEHSLAKQRIAACYAYLNNPQQAVDYYRDQSLTEDLSPNDQLLLAMSLKKMGEYKAAQKWFERYAAFDQEAGSHYAQTCAEALAIQMQEEQFLIFPLNNRAREHEFGPCVGPNGLLFNKINTKKHPSDCEYGIYTAEGEEAFFEEAHAVEWRVGTHHDRIFIDYSPSGEKVLFTKISDKTCFNGLTAKNSMAIYEAEVQSDGSWMNERALPFNSLGSSTAYAAYGNSDDEIFFSSDQNSGFGGFDLYWAKRDHAGKWSKARNLGPSVNSEGDEIAPQWNGFDLVFASNWHAGLGGFDLFYSSLASNQFQEPINLGRPINSTMDDWNLVFVDRESGYFCTNRNMNKSGSDIFYFTELKEQPIAKAIFTSELLTEEEASLDVFESEELEQAGDFIMALPIDFKGNPSEVRPDVPQNVKAVFSIQVAVLDKNNNDFSAFNQKLGDIDAIYKIYYDRVVKIRVGSYENELKAEQVLAKIKSRGYKDAFIVKEKMIIAQQSETELEKASQESADAAVDGKYMIRLATYMHPEYFQKKNVEHLGEIIKMEKDPYTIFLIGHYNELDKARQLLEEARKSGFQNAQIVVQESNTLRRVE